MFYYYFYLPSEYEDLTTGQSILQDMVERLGIPVFNNVRSALDCTAKVIYLLFINSSFLKYAMSSFFVGCCSRLIFFLRHCLPNVKF